MYFYRSLRYESHEYVENHFYYTNWHDYLPNYDYHSLKQSIWYRKSYSDRLLESLLLLVATLKITCIVPLWQPLHRHIKFTWSQAYRFKKVHIRNCQNRKLTDCLLLIIIFTVDQIFKYKYFCCAVFYYETQIRWFWWRLQPKSKGLQTPPICILLKTQHAKSRYNCLIWVSQPVKPKPIYCMFYADYRAL